MYKMAIGSRLACIVALVACTGGSLLAAKAPATVIVTPSRIRVVQLVQDMFRTRTLQVVSYQGKAATVDPVLHKWNGKDWTRITLEDFLATLPERIVLIGDETALPTVLVEASSRSEDARTIPTFDVASVLGEFQKLFDLSPSEMTALARNNGVQVVDRNAELRRYGKYYPGPGYDQLQGKAPQEQQETTGKPAIPQEPELAPVKIEPVGPEASMEPAETVAPTKSPAPESAKVDISPDDK